MLMRHALGSVQVCVKTVSSSVGPSFLAPTKGSLAGTGTAEFDGALARFLQLCVRRASSSVGQFLLQPAQHCQVPRNLQITRLESNIVETMLLLLLLFLM